MTGTALAPHMHLARIGRDLVLLDLEADNYLCIPEGVAELRPSADLAQLHPADPDVLVALIDAGILRNAVTGERRCPPALPRRDLMNLAVVRLRPREAIRLLACLWDLACSYRGQPLNSIVAFAARGSAKHSENPEETLRLSRLFQHVVPWLPISRKCLVRSFVLLRFLQRSGVNAEWVFGVRTWPFAAHCWLQLGDVALDDVPERLAVYEPIYVVA